MSRGAGDRPAAPDAPRGPDRGPGRDASGRDAPTAASDDRRGEAFDPAPSPQDPGLRAVAEACDWVMRFDCRSAPGLVFVGARSDPARVWDDPALRGAVGGHAGGGETPEAAFAACMGEAAEFLCQFERPGDLLPPGDPTPDHPALEGWTPPDAARLRAVRRPDGAAVALPAARVLRRPGPAPPFRLSTGCAAGASPEAARLSALLEGVERDAAAFWWRGGRAARALDLTDPALAQAALRIAGWRAGAQAPRRAWALQLDAAGDVPVVAMLTTDPEGRDLSIGVAARPSLAAALLSAAREAVQGELSLDLIAERRALHGEAVLGPADRDRLALAALDPRRWARLLPQAPPGPRRPRTDGADGAGDSQDAGGACGRAGGVAEAAARGVDSATIFNALVESLAIEQHSCLDVDLTRSRFGLPVVFATAPALQPFPAAHVSPRLAAAQAAARAKAGPGAALDGSDPDAPLF